jgi:hypothetical protein
MLANPAVGAQGRAGCAANLAEELRKIGVPGVVASGWAVADRDGFMTG